jgi:PAS domain S-box-containing protein
MNTPSPSSWVETAKPGWRVDRPGVAKSANPFFAEHNNGHYESVLQRMPAMLHIMDSSGRMISANAEWLKVLGYELNDVVGRSFSEILPQDARSKLITTIYPKYLVTGECSHEEILMLRKDGSMATIVMSMVGIRGDNGRLQKSVCLLEDTTRQKIASLTSSRVDARYKTAFVSAPQGIALLSPNGGVQLANAALRDFFKRHDIEEIAISYDDLIHRDDRGQFLNGMRQLLSGEVPVLQQDVRYMTGDGKVVHGATSVSLIKNDKNETEQVIIQVFDVTERKQLRQRLHAQQKTELAGQVAGGLATDFKRILAVLHGNLDLLRHKFGDDAVSNQRLEEAMNAVLQGADLTDKLLSFSLQQDLDSRDIGIHETLSRIEAGQGLPAGIDLRIKKMAGDPRLLADPVRLEAILSEIIKNSIDAMPDGGKLVIETDGVFLDHEYAGQNPGVASGHYVLVSITDSGRGMPQEQLEKVVHPFFTTKPYGKGLGLATVYGFVRQSGGHFAIYSEIGNGTTVKLYLPRRMRPGEEDGRIYDAPFAGPGLIVDAQSEPHELAMRKPKILVVEDQEAVRAVACGFLEDFGYDVIEAGDGFEALTKLQEVDDIDLMFSDVVMPGGMNGFDLAQAAQSMKPTLKVVHTSGYPKGAMVHQDEPRFREGFIIMKPYRREDLQKIIKDALETQ